MGCHRILTSLSKTWRATTWARLAPLGTLAAWLLSAPLIQGQEPAAPGSEEQRRLIPGILTVIPSEPQEGETTSSTVPLIEITKGHPELDWTPNFAAKSSTLYAKAQAIQLRRQVWNLEFAFKPLRMILVDIPQPSGKMRRKRVWYMVYRVKYKGEELTPTPQRDDFQNLVYTIASDQRYAYRYFLPHFVLESGEVGKAYLDQIIPSAIPLIQARETPGRRLLNSVEMSQERILLSTDRIDRSVWGVVTWEDIDPRIDYLSIYIRGLTNAYKFLDDENFKPGDPPGQGRKFAHKTLVLNFWRPGDSVLEHEDEIRYGVPVAKDPSEQQRILEKYGLEERLDHLWIYR